MILIKVKMGIQPFSLKSVYTILIFLIIYILISYLPLSGNIFIDIVWKSFIVLGIFIPLLLKLELSEDINKIVSDIRKRLGI